MINSMNHSLYLFLFDPTLICLNISFFPDFISLHFCFSRWSLEFRLLPKCEPGFRTSENVAGVRRLVVGQLWEHSHGGGHAQSEDSGNSTVTLLQCKRTNQGPDLSYNNGRMDVWLHTLMNGWAYGWTGGWRMCGWLTKVDGSLIELHPS